MSAVKEAIFVSKISAKKIGLGMDEIRDAVKSTKKGAAVKLFTVYGLISACKHGDGDNGPWTKFSGQFEAMHSASGDVYRSGSMFLPDQVTPILEGKLLAASKAEGFMGMQVAFEIGAIKSEVAVGYEFTVKDLMPATKDTDPLIAMREQVAQGKLAAPTN